MLNEHATTPSADLPAATHANRHAGRWTTVVATGVVVSLILAFLAVMPNLGSGHYEILDDPLFCARAQGIAWSNPDSYVFLPHIRYLARPGFFIVLVIPKYFPDATVHYWLQTLLFLALPVALLFLLLCSVSRGIVIPGLAVCALLTNASFTENYYTLMKQDPPVWTGGVLTTILLWRIVSAPEAVGIARHVLVWAAALAGAVLTFTVKETGAALFPVLLVAIPLLGWAYRIPRWTLIKRTAPLVAANAVALLVLLYFYQHLEWQYTAGGRSSYSTGIPALWAGACRLSSHFCTAAPYVLPAMLIAVLAAVWYVRNTEAVRDDPAFRRRMAWTCYYSLFFCAATCILMPWQSLEPRHYLVAAMNAVMASCFAADLGFMLARRSCKRLWRVALRAMSGVTMALLVLHAVYGLLVGPLGEGRIRHVADEVGAHMLAYVARATPRSGTAYFMTDPSLPEPRENTMLWLRCFHQRGDIKCVFPERVESLGEPGLLAATDYVGSYVPNRIPIHYTGRRNFLQAFAPRVALCVVTQFAGRVGYLYTDAKGYRGYQFKATWGIPAFWELKRGSFQFAWCIYAYGATSNAAPNLVSNGTFAEGLKGWEYWAAANTHTDTVTVTGDAVRLCSPDGQLAGIKQVLASPLASGAVYRLRVNARHVGAPLQNRVQGGRVAIYLPPQQEQEIKWLTQRNTWWLQDLVFTNTVAGRAIVLVHMGYGKIASTGEFTDIRLEQVDQGATGDQ